MLLLENYIKNYGYDIYKISYPSLKYDIATLADFVKSKLESAGIWSNYKKIHFVTHSMGGVLARIYLNLNRDNILEERLGRVVMIAPPNQGSEVTDFLKDFFLYRWIFGLAGQELTILFQERENKVDIYYELGIIAGDKRWSYPFARFIISFDSDGRVAVSRTKLDGMSDHIVVSTTHSFISWKASTHQHVIQFLKNGRFGE